MRVTNALLQAAVAEGTLDEYMQKHVPLVSGRGLPLIATSTFPDGAAPVVTVELYCKWYYLYVVRREKDEFIVEQVPFPSDIEYCASDRTTRTRESPYVDHVPNPYVVARWAEAQGYVIDELALEVMIGRWEREGLDHYSNMEEMPCQNCNYLGSSCKC